MSAAPPGRAAAQSAAPVRVWDLPIRLFHWLLVVLVSFSIVTAQLGEAWIEWHMRSGYTILALLVFRLVWGFIGPHTARFSSFVASPRRIAAYVRGGMREHGAGHSPLGAAAVLLILFILSIQVASGLFANDDIASEGVLAAWVSKATSDWFAGLHDLNAWFIYGAIALHLGAIAFYQFARSRNLVGPMISGDAPASEDSPTSPVRDGWGTRLSALILFALIACAVYFLAHLAPPALG